MILFFEIHFAARQLYTRMMPEGCWEENPVGNAIGLLQSMLENPAAAVAALARLASKTASAGLL